MRISESGESIQIIRPEINQTSTEQVASVLGAVIARQTQKPDGYPSDEYYWSPGQLARDGGVEDSLRQIDRLVVGGKVDINHEIKIGEDTYRIAELVLRIESGINKSKKIHQEQGHENRSQELTQGQKQKGLDMLLSGNEPQ